MSNAITTTAEPTTLLPLVIYERPAMEIASMTGSVLVEDVTVAFPIRTLRDGRFFEEPGEPEAYKKYTLFPTEAGTTLELVRSSEDEEGWSQDVAIYEQGWLNADPDDLTRAWEIGYVSDGSDCDGRLTRTADFRSFGGTDPDAPDHMPGRSDQFKVGGHQRDYSAEAAGY
jgi:hypothetical protein